MMHEQADRHQRAADHASIGLREALANEPLGDDDGEDDDGDDAAGVKQELNGREELGVEEQEYAGRSGERQGEPEDGVKQVLREHYGERGADEQHGQDPEGDVAQCHASPPAGFAAGAPAAAGGACSARAIFGGPCMSRSLLPVAQDT